jgi:hypothetical protein
MAEEAPIHSVPRQTHTDRHPCAIRLLIQSIVDFLSLRHRDWLRQLQDGGCDCDSQSTSKAQYQTEIFEIPGNEQPGRQSGDSKDQEEPQAE